MINATFNITLIDDNIFEDEETFTMMIDEHSLSNKVTTEGAINHGTVRIASSEESKPLNFSSICNRYTYH